MAAAIGAAQAKMVACKPDWEVVCGLLCGGGWLAREENDYHHYVSLTASLWPDTAQEQFTRLLTADI